MFNELVVIICTIIEIFVIIWGLSQINREIKESAATLSADLDHKLASVIQNLGINPDAEPINPIQAAIANMISMRMQGAPGSNILREVNGQFVKKQVQNITNDNKE